MKKFEIIKGVDRFHFVGIGGINMSAIAEILHKNGYIISGSDKSESATTKRLATLGVDVKIGHDPSNIPSNAQAMVYNAAISKENPEYMEAIKRGIITLDRAEALGLLMKNFENAICVAGTHGKTSTTSMLAQIFTEAGVDPTVLSGGVLPFIGGAMRIGGEEYFIAEACEYHNSFLKFNPTVGIILNIEMDHSDFFESETAFRQSFRDFAEKIPSHGLLIINSEIKNYEEITKGLACKVITFGDVNDVAFTKDGKSSFATGGSSFTLSVPGMHNISNALAAIACARHFNLDISAVSKALEGFTGANRRFQHIGKFEGATVIDDYAHHPTEVSATLKSAKNINHNRLWAVFQPHTPGRVSDFLQEFTQALSIADQIIVLDIYRPAGREDEKAQITSQDLAKNISANHANCHYIGSFEEAASFIRKNTKEKDIVITMGAGDSNILSQMIVGE